MDMFHAIQNKYLDDFKAAMDTDDKNVRDAALLPKMCIRDRDNILIPFYLDHRTPDEQMLRKLTGILGIEIGRAHV